MSAFHRYAAIRKSGFNVSLGSLAVDQWRSLNDCFLLVYIIWCDWGQCGAHIPLQLNYKPVNLTSNRLLWEFWLSFFYSQGSLRYKAFLDYKKAYRLQNPTAIRGHLHLAGLCLFSFPSNERLTPTDFKWKPNFGFQTFHDSSSKSIQGEPQ